MSDSQVRAAPGLRVDLGEVETRVLFGVQDENLRLIEAELGVQVAARDQEVFLEGSEAAVRSAAKILVELARMVSRGHPVTAVEIRTAIQVATENPAMSLERFFSETEIRTAKGRRVRARGPNQRIYLEAIRAHDVVFATGPAGTGKTFLAMAMAIAALNERRVRRIILARPAIEAGERLGFLPGDMMEKVNPYLRPLYDALYALVDFDQAGRLIERGEIEIAPIAFMRGRTLSDSFAILDEAQNTTPEQMKMFLTRLGVNSRAVINGDTTQIDLRNGQKSGLIEAREVLAGIPGIGHVRFDERDVVRHDLVKRIVTAYGQHDARVEAAQKRASEGHEEDQ